MRAEPMILSAKFVLFRIVKEAVVVAVGIVVEKRVATVSVVALGAALEAGDVFKLARLKGWSWTAWVVVVVVPVEAAVRLEPGRRHRRR